jgi:hypothetical protein
MNAPRIDCHFHTTKSDGMYTPERAVSEAKRVGLSFAACTNHDLIDRDIVGLLADEGIGSVPAVEISACDYAQESDGGKKSLHVTAFSHSFDAEFDSALLSVRDARIRKVRGQIEQLSALGFDIDWNGFEKYWTEIGLGIANATNAHIREYLFPETHCERLFRNVRQYEALTGKRLDSGRFIDRHLKRESEAPFGYFPIPDYEPGYEVLASVRKRCGAILSIAHPNYTFKKEGIEGFERSALRAIETGAVNALEIHFSTPPEWIAKILEIRDRTNALITFGSDCHFKESYDKKHSWLGELNPHVDAVLVDTEFARFQKALIS